MLVKVTDYTTLQAALEALCQELDVKKVSKETVFDCKLVACELLGNVLKHGDGLAELHSEIQDGAVIVRVLSKQSFDLPEKIICSETLAESGRGLFLVNTICEEQVFTEGNAIVAKIKLK
jgi:anti-sigma regulatory factor (Ser/Thr protein kinase)